MRSCVAPKLLPTVIEKTASADIKTGAEPDSPYRHQMICWKWFRARWSGPKRKEGYLEDRLKELMQELGNAINESLSDSDRIAAAIGEIKRAGYDVFLVLEATIGFNKREEGEEAHEENETVELEPAAPESGRRRVGKIKLTTQDQKFLRALKIAIDEESR